MKSKGRRYNKKQIIYALKQVEGGRAIAEVCRKFLGERFVKGEKLHFN